MVEFDQKDLRLLYELDKNSRQSISSLAKKIGLSKDAVSYRMKLLSENEVIKSFNAVIDTSSLGFLNFRILIKLFNATPEKETEIIEFFLGNQNLIWLVKAEGRWNINTWFLYKSITEMNAFWKTLIEKYGNFIAKRELGIYTSITYFGRSYLWQNAERFSMKPCSSLPPIKIGKKDFEIISILSQDARTTIIEISKKTGLTTKTVISRIKFLEKTGIIQGYRAEFDISKLGYKYYKIHLSIFNATEDKLRKLFQMIKSNPNVVYLDEVLGGYDIEIEVQAKGEDQLRTVIDEIRTKFGDMLKDYEIMHYFKEYKLRFFPKIPEK